MSLVYSNGAPKPLYYPDGATLYLNWLNNTRFGNEPTINRNGAVLMLGPDGYQSFAANVLARIDEVGAQVAPARVNKCTNYNAAPTGLTGVTKTGDAAATLTVVDDEAALRSAGFGYLINEGVMNGRVYKLDNGAGTVPAFADFGGAVGNLNAHTCSVHMRGAGNVAVRLTTNGPTPSAFNSPDDYVLRSNVVTPASTSDSLRLRVEAGSIVYFILNQLEEGSYASPPIITSGAAVSRPGDILSDSVPEITEYGVAGIFRFNAIAPEGNATFRLLSFSDGTDLNRLSLGRVTDGFINFGLANGSISPFIPSMTYKTGEQTVVFAVGTDFAAMRRVGETQLGGERTVTLPSGLNKVGILGGGNNTSTNQLGNAEDLTLWMGTAGKPVDQNFFDEVYAKATS